MGHGKMGPHKASECEPPPCMERTKGPGPRTMEHGPHATAYPDLAVAQHGEAPFISTRSPSSTRRTQHYRSPRGFRHPALGALMVHAHALTFSRARPAPRERRTTPQACALPRRFCRRADAHHPNTKEGESDEGRGGGPARCGRTRLLRRLDFALLAWVDGILRRLLEVALTQRLPHQLHT